jgi:hypothetical protein
MLMDWITVCMDIERGLKQEGDKSLRQRHQKNVFMAAKLYVFTNSLGLQAQSDVQA